jgi:hypothetical protein
MGLFNTFFEKKLIEPSKQNRRSYRLGIRWKDMMSAY